MDEAENPADRSLLRLPFEPGQWVDADEVIFQACFTLLGQYVENELGTEAWDIAPDALYRGYRLHFADIDDNDPSGMPARRSPNRTAIDLWLWYKTELPALEEEYAQDISECYSGKWKIEPAENGLSQVVDFGKIREPKFPYDYPETIKDEKLRELINLRRALWT